ncbi:primosomal protein N' [soil metagenome]
MAFDAEQLALVAPVGRPSRAVVRDAAPELPIARVVVDVSLAHLDRAFDYLVPAALHEQVVVGCRVTVRFSGKQVSGYVVERVDLSAHEGRLAPILKVVSSEIVLRPDVLETCRRIATRYAGVLPDVLRLAVPPRHARTEKAEQAATAPVELVAGGGDQWAPYAGGMRFLDALAAGDSARACWAALPSADPARAIAEAVAAVIASGRGAIVCVPDLRDVERFDSVFTEVLGAQRHVVLTAAQGPGARYRSFLKASRGEVPVVLGTRAAAFAPVHDLGLVVIFDDGDDLFADQHAPYPHAREVLLTRALVSDAAVLVGGFARTAEAQQLVVTGWCEDLVASVVDRRRGWARVEVADEGLDGPARLPHAVFRVMRAALESGPILLQVPRRGYRSALACQTCRQPAHCEHCEGPLVQTSARAPVSCAWCGKLAPAWRCAHCRGTQLRAPVVGQMRTAEEIGLAFPTTTIWQSGGDHVISQVSAAPSIVIATPGAEPHAEGGYAAAVLLDSWLMLGRPDMRVNEESHRRWFNAAAKVRSSEAGGRVVIVGEASMFQALVRTDPVGLAQRELDDRASAHLPPATRLATVEGPAETLLGLLDADWPQPSEVLGPVPVDTQRGEDPRSRLIVRVPRGRGTELSRALHLIQARRSAAKLKPVRVEVDPAAF